LHAPLLRCLQPDLGVYPCIRHLKEAGIVLGLSAPSSPWLCRLVCLAALFLSYPPTVLPSSTGLSRLPVHIML
jgi:hypothetical protein